MSTVRYTTPQTCAEPTTEQAADVAFGSLTAALANDGRGCFTPISGRRSASGKGLIETMLIVLTNEENDYANRANLVGGADPTLRG
jgi:hypothetical protein